MPRKKGWPATGPFLSKVKETDPMIRKQGKTVWTNQGATRKGDGGKRNLDPKVKDCDTDVDKATQSILWLGQANDTLVSRSSSPNSVFAHFSIPRILYQCRFLEANEIYDSVLFEKMLSHKLKIPPT